MRLNNELKNLKETDVYSLLLFALSKLINIPEYSALCELCYVLDKDNLLKLCEYFGGTTLKIPTVHQLENLMHALLLYQYVNIEHGEFEEALTASVTDEMSVDEVKDTYVKICEVMKNYEFGNKKDTLSPR